MFAVAFYRFHGNFDIAHIVHRIKYAEYIDTADRCALHKTLNNIIGIVAIAQQVLATQQHLLRGFGHGFFKLANAIPGVFTQIANAGIKGGAAPGFERPKTDAVQFGRNRQHVIQTQAGGKQ